MTYHNCIISVYLYHEVSQLFRKESRDFCVLQSDKIEGVKHIVSIRSVGWPGCADNDDVIRGKVRNTCLRYTHNDDVRKYTYNDDVRK